MIEKLFMYRNYAHARKVMLKTDFRNCFTSYQCTNSVFGIDICVVITIYYIIII